jgi:hypothetical protein
LSSASSDSTIGISFADVLVAGAIKVDLQQTIDQSYQQIQVEGNFKVLIDSIIGRISTPWKIKFLVHDILQFSHYCQTIHFN